MLIQLAAERRQIMDHYSDSHYNRLIEVEAAIAASPHITDACRQIKQGILYETEEPDFQDEFKLRLFKSLR